MPLIQALVLGIVQGLTEFIPVSSSGHLIIFPHLFGWKEQSIVFDTTMHLATSLALIVCFWDDIVEIVRGFIKNFRFFTFRINKYSPEGKMGVYIILATMPVALVGYLFESGIENTFRSVLWVSLFLILGSFLLYIGERLFAKRLIVSDEISYGKSIGIGLFQILSLLPGVSRSGSTISSGMIFGLSRKDATRFSFIASIPVILMAGLLNLVKSYKSLTLATSYPLIVGFISAFIVGVLAVKFLMRFVKTNTLYPFIIYRILLAIFLILIVLR